MGINHLLVIEDTYHNSIQGWENNYSGIRGHAERQPQARVSFIT